MRVLSTWDRRKRSIYRVRTYLLLRRKFTETLSWTKQRLSSKPRCISTIKTTFSSDDSFSYLSYWSLSHPIEHSLSYWSLSLFQFGMDSKWWLDSIKKHNKNEMINDWFLTFLVKSRVFLYIRDFDIELIVGFEKVCRYFFGPHDGRIFCEK